MTDLTDFLTNLFTCGFHQLPLQTFINSYLPTSSFLSTMSECLNRIDVEAINKANDCNKYVGEWCGGNADIQRRDMAAAERRQCSKIIRYFQRRRPTSLTRKTLYELRSAVPEAFYDESEGKNFSDSQTYDRISQSRLASNSSSLPLIAGAKIFFDHFRCLDQLNKTCYSQCIEPAMAKCHKNANLIVLKVLRVRMSDIEALLTRLPGIHVIHYVRDPRAMALSRVEAGLALLQDEQHNRRRIISQMMNMLEDQLRKRKEAVMVTESKHLCNRMLLDLRARQRLEAQHPGGVSVIRYEDLIMDPRRIISGLIGRIGTSVPGEKFYQWLHGIMFAKTEGTHFDYIRANATSTAEKWKKRIKYRHIVQMNQYCERVLLELGYEV